MGLWARVVVLLFGLLLSGLSAKAETIASQDFGSANFPSSLSLDSGSISSAVTHAGSGAAGTDLGFSANGLVSGSGSGSFEVAGGEVTFTHFSSTSDVSTHSTAEDASGASTVTFSDGTDHSAFFYSQVVDLSGFEAKSFSMDVGDVVGATNTVDDDIVVRLWVNGSSEVVLVDTRGNSSGALAFGAITHVFADTDTSAQLLVDLFSDDDADGYRIDNILFEGMQIDPNIVTFAADPIIKPAATAGEAYVGSISLDASDLDNDALTFSKVSGPSWLSVAADGSLSGTPATGDAGFNTFTVRVDDTDDGFATATLLVTVLTDLPTGSMSWGTVWKYLDDGSNQGTAWRSPTFDDTSWASGAGQLGFGDSDETTSLNAGYITYYFRHELNVRDASHIAGATFDLLYDDGAIVYLNGTEVYRTSLIVPATGEVSYSSGTSASVGSDNFVESGLPIDKSLFVDGPNIFAVEVHNRNSSSSDISFDFNLALTEVNPDAPTFSQDPISAATARATVAYSASIAGSATDLNSDPISYSKVSGPEWLSVAADGSLSGVPALGNQGLNTFTVQASDGIYSTSVGLTIQVNDPNGNPPIIPEPANIDHIRLVWVDDPSTTVTVAWKHLSGSDAVVKYGTVDNGRFEELYSDAKSVDRTASYSSITTKFSRLTGLQADTKYYFVVADSVGVSERYWFRTAADTPKPFSFVAGGDSRNNRTPRQRANRLVGKIRPLFVAFTGDMINSDNETEWNEWLTDWEETVSSDGQMFPILPHRGNHESRGNSTVYHLFDTTADNYYGLTFGGDLLRFYVLNSESGESTQATWMQNDLDSLGGVNAFTHLMAGYHKPMRPHSSSKSNGTAEYNAWAQLFYDYRFDLVMESDTHTMKRTLPIRPSTESGSDEGFITSVSDGTVYIGEGCWGAPLRSANDARAWTADQASFNGFDLVHVHLDYSEVYTVRVDNEATVAELAEGEGCSLPAGIDLWQAAGGTRLVVNRGATPKTSYAQYQLDTFGGNLPAASSHATGNVDGDTLSNFEEFAWGLDATTVDSAADMVAALPSIEIGGNQEKWVKHRRRSDTTVQFRYYISQDRQTWTLMQEGVDYTLTSTPGSGYDDVRIEIIGARADYDKAFFLVTPNE